MSAAAQAGDYPEKRLELENGELNLVVEDREATVQLSDGVLIPERSEEGCEPAIGGTQQPTGYFGLIYSITQKKIERLNFFGGFDSMQVSPTELAGPDDTSGALAGSVLFRLNATAPINGPVVVEREFKGIVTSDPERLVVGQYIETFGVGEERTCVYRRYLKMRSPALSGDIGESTSPDLISIIKAYLRDKVLAPGSSNTTKKTKDTAIGVRG
jgi:hypothetical protein